MKLTPDQLRLFWRTFAEAKGLHGIPESEADAWRKEIIRRATGRESLTEVTRTAEFDAVMYELARLAQNPALTERFALADSKRLVHLIERNVGAILAAKNGGLSSADYCVRAYIRAILKKRGVTVRASFDWWYDLTNPQLLSLARITGSSVSRLKRVTK